MVQITPDWSDTLVDRIVAQDFVLFVGVGVSHPSINSHGQQPPLWKELIEALAAKFLTTSPADKTLVEQAIRKGDLLSAAEVVERYCNSNGRRDDFRKEICRLTDGGASPADVYLPNELHNLIGELAPRIIFTTNFDKILERHFMSGFATLRFEASDIAAQIRQGTDVLVKLHGDKDDPNQLILTRLDFTRLRRDGAHALETLEALLLTRTALFVGYSLDDPDLRLVLENRFGAKGGRPGHYLIGSNRTSEDQKLLFREAYGVTIAEYSGEPGPGVKRSLTALVEKVSAKRALSV